MNTQVLIAHAEGEENLAEQLAGPLREAGYEVVHRGTVLVGDSVVEAASKALALGGPVVLCGTVRALGTRWARRMVAAARRYSGVRVFVIQMEEDADVEAVAFDEQIARYWEDPARAVTDLITAIRKYYPSEATTERATLTHDALQRYRELLLESCDIIDLANLPEGDRHIATRRLELRRLYVPLRVQVEIVPDKEPDEAAFRRFEQRRRVAWGEREEREQEVKRVPVGERLTAARRLVLLGDPGAGKSTLLRWVTTAYLLRLKHDSDWRDLPDVATLPDENWLPILVRCRELDESCLNGSLEDVLCHTLRRAELTRAESDAIGQLLSTSLRGGKALLLLDGLDEIVDPAARVRFARHIEQIQAAYPQAAIIATSRVVGYREMGYRISRFEHVVVTDLSEEEKDDFAQRWCAVTEPPERRETATKELVEAIHSSDRIERLTGNPMLLTTLALVKRKVGKLPTRRAELYWEAVQVLLNWRSEVDAPMDQREAIPQLEYLAYAMCDRGVQQIRQDEVLELFEQMRAEYPNVHAAQQHTPEEFLLLLERRTGLLVDVGYMRHLGRPMPVYEFRHLTLQEYLAGLALVDGRYPGRDRSRSLADQVAQLTGRISDVQPSLPSERREFMRREPEPGVAENWREALRLCVASCSDDDVDAVLMTILQPLPDEDTTRSARPRAILAALCLADEPNVSESTEHEVIESFASRVKEGDGGGFVKTSLDAATMELATSRHAAALRMELQEEFWQRDSEDRWNVGGLGAMVVATNAPQDDPELRAWLRSWLEKASEERMAIELAICVSLLAFRGRNCIVSDISHMLLNMLKGTQPAAYSAAWALSWMSNIERHGDGAWHPTPADLDQLVAYMSKPTADPEAASWVATVLGQTGDARAVEPLLAALNVPNLHLRRAVTKALGRIGDVRAVELLIARLEDADADIRGDVIEALGSIGDARAVEPLITQLKDEDVGMRQEAAEALGRIGNSAVEPLIARLHDADENVRLAVIRALGGTRDVRAVEPLIARLEDTDAGVRQTVADALGRIGDAQAIGPLIARLEDTNADVRQAVVEALGRIDDARAQESLVVRLEDADGNVRRAAVGGLARPSCRDKTDRCLLSRDLDAAEPFLDPATAISEEQVQQAAKKLALSSEEIRLRYEALAPRFHLRLAWQVKTLDSVSQ